MKYLLQPLLIAALLLFFINTPSFAQRSNDSIPPCPVKDIKDVFRKKNSTAKPKPPKDYFLLLTPVISSLPATGFVIGVASQLTFKGPGADAKFSSASANAQYTTKNQALFNVKNNVFLLDNKLFLSGDWRLFLFSQPTYGLGTGMQEKLSEVFL